tara:strand:- start:557 stop:1240 length:684 start_codon:yes stop_codon:yes gene_type:complete
MPANAQQIRVFYSSGTGFIVSKDGHVITNAHVVRGCASPQVELRGAMQGSGRVIARDDANDLALIDTSQHPDTYAYLSADTRTVKPGEDVMVMGYPLEAAQTGEYAIAMAEVIADKGPTGEAQWMQFSSSAQQGNSGGPLLDSSGHVIGVVTGKTDLFEVNETMRTRKYLSSSDIAVALPILKAFLDDNRIRYTTRPGGTRRSGGWMENRARQFITNIRCETGREVS